MAMVIFVRTKEIDGVDPRRPSLCRPFHLYSPRWTVVRSFVLGSRCTMQDWV